MAKLTEEQKRRKLNQHCALCGEVGVSYVKLKGGFFKLCDDCWEFARKNRLTVKCEIVRAAHPELRGDTE